MENKTIRLLTADEIECRVGTISEKGLSLLLYKDARADMKILDEVFGPNNWQRTHEVIGGNLYCNVQIYDEQKKTVDFQNGRWYRELYGKGKRTGINYIFYSQEVNVMAEVNRIPIGEKVMLTLEEASSYTGIGINKLRELSNHENCDFVLWNGTRRLLKRKKLEEFLNNSYSI